MRVLVTGAGGFAGRHAVAELTAHGHTVLAADLRPPAAAPGVDPHTLDVLDADRVAGLVRATRPDACLHLAGMAYVPQAWAQPAHAFRVNTVATLSLIEAFRDHARAAAIVVVTSAEVYGAHARRVAIQEDAALRPDTLYGLSKAAADEAVRALALHDGLRLIAARPGNHIGPGQSPDFVVPAFARQLAAIRTGAPARLRVGNLDSRRDFTDVRDIVRGYRLLLEGGRAGAAYNLASGRLVRIGDILDRLCALTGVQPHIEIDPARYRPADQGPKLDTTRIRTELGWAPAVPLDTTLRDIVAAA